MFIPGTDCAAIKHPNPPVVKRKEALDWPRTGGGSLLASLRPGRVPHTVTGQREASMKNSSRKILAAAAFAGLLSGAVIQQGRADTPTNIAPGKVAPEKKAPKVQGCAGQNDCKGIGGCKTADHDCKFKNACKGKGGCEITAKDIEGLGKDAKEEKAAPKPTAY